VREDAGRSGPEAPLNTSIELNVHIGLLRDLVLLCSFRVPHVDVQTLDLFDQQENRLSGRAKLVIVIFLVLGRRTGGETPARRPLLPA
jgi:hypothetical protein